MSSIYTFHDVALRVLMRETIILLFKRGIHFSRSANRMLRGR